MFVGEDIHNYSIRCQSRKKRLQSLCFCIALTVNFVDQLWQFTLPVVVPYGVMLGADLKTIAFFTTARGFGGILSNFWMPLFANGPKGGEPRRRLAVLISLIGCTLGYVTQGSAISFQSGAQASHVFALGRFVTGFFSGMGPVLSAYITELSSGDDELLRNRFKHLQMTNAILGLCLAPLAGALAELGLQVPFYVATGVGIVTFIVAAAYFKESSELVENSVCSSLDALLEEFRSTYENGKVTEEGNPYCDVVTWLIAIAQVCLALIISGYMLLLPTLISQPRFGIQGQTAAIKQQHVASISGFLIAPLSLAIIGSTLLLFMPLRERFGDLPVSLIASVLLGCMLTSLGFVSHELWLLALLNFFNGLILGSFSPGLLTMFSRYVKKEFPTKQTVAHGVPLTAGQLTVMFAQNIMAAVISNHGVGAGSLYIGVCSVVYATMFSLANLVASRSKAGDHSLQERLLSVSKPQDDAILTSPTLLSGRPPSQDDKALKGI